MIVAGADGCPTGWICVSRNAGEYEIRSHRFRDARALLDQQPQPDVLAIDIPIGLPARGTRVCDVEARQLLGRPRASSVFPAPARPLLGAATHREAGDRRQALEGKRISLQAFGILGKVHEVDRILGGNPTLQRRVREVHPELSFRAWAGRPMRQAKKKKAGRAERQELVDAYFGLDAFASIRARYRAREVASDDILDAFAALWTAERIAQGSHGTLPEDPPTDERGLRMEIVY